MQSSTLVSSFAEIASEKDIDRDALQLIMEDVFRAMINKRYGATAEDPFEIIFNPDNGDIQIIHVRTVVSDFDVEDPVTQISTTEAHKIDADFEEGDEVAEEVSVQDFGRRAVLTARQTFAQRIRDIEKDNIHEQYADMIGEIVIGEVYQTRRKEVLVIHERTELVLPREEQLLKDRYRKGDMIRAVVKEVARDIAGTPQVIISRADPAFMERLFELEVPEIADEIVEIKAAKRHQMVRPNNRYISRAKVAVYSNDDRIDPVGACVGMKGVRIHAVARELGNEGIDVIPWHPDPAEMVRRSLAPAKPVSVELSEDSRGQKRARVLVRADEVSQAIGEGGINIRLASELTGYEIDIYREVANADDDVDIKEFKDELSEEVVTRLSEVGIDSARAALELGAEELARRAAFTPEVAETVLRVIRAEFDDE